MKNSAKAKLTAILLAFGASCIAPTVTAGQSHSCERCGHKVPMMRLLRKIDLSDDQKQQAKELVKAYKQSMRSDRASAAERQEHYDNMQILIKAPGFDDQAARDLVSQNNRQRLDAAVARIKLRHDLYQLLTPAQQTKAQDLKADYKKRHNR